MRRRIIDYTEAGQWSEVYDGPLEDCESEKLKAENAKLVMRLNAEHLVRQNVERENAKLRELCADMAAEIRGLGVDFARVGWCDYADRMRELGVDA